MRSLPTTAAVLITAVLSLLLIGFVFFSDSSRPEGDQFPRCGSRQALAQVKDEIFRRAAGVRRASDGAFDGVAQHSIVRTASRIVRRHHRGSDKVTCAGAIALDLPPGTAVVGGRRSLTAQVQYQLAPARGGSPRLLSLSKVDTIVVPLASVGAVSQTPQLIAQAPAEVDAGALPPAEPATAPPPTVQSQNAASAKPRTVSAPARGNVRRDPPQVARRAAVKPAEPARTASADPPRRPSPQPRQTVAASTPAAPASVKPSFNCRYARTRSEIAVCKDANLASLDRSMSAQFYRALSAARPGQRAMLQRSRTRFLNFRDSCASESCIAEAYRGRMREISDIMSGSF